MTLQEMLQARAEKIKAQRAIFDKAKSENRDMTEEEEKQFNAMEAEIVDLEAKIDAARQREHREAVLAARESSLNEPLDKPFRPQAVGGAPVQDPKKENYGFASLGEFVHAVRFGDSKGRLEAIRNDMSMGSDADGGYAVPEQFREELLRIDGLAAIVRPRAQVIPPGTPPDEKITIPAFHQGADGILGGVQVQWIAEGAAKPKTDPKLEEVTLQPNEAAAHVVVTDKLLRNWQAADGFVRTLLRQAITQAEDIAFLTGDGTGKPTGVLNAATTGALTVNRATANQIGFVDLVNMVAKLLPQSLSTAVWVASQSALPQIMQLKDENNNNIFIRGDVTRGIADTLLGRPILWTGKVSALGTKGDLSLVDFSYYLIKDGSGPFIAASEHVHFVNNKTVIKAFWNVDGKAWVSAPLTLEDGSTQVSPYVILDVPAA